MGQSFSEQPHVVVYKDSKKLHFLTIETIASDRTLSISHDKSPANDDDNMSISDDII